MQTNNSGIYEPTVLAATQGHKAWMVTWEGGLRPRAVVGIEAWRKGTIHEEQPLVPHIRGKLAILKPRLVALVAVLLEVGLRHFVLMTRRRNTARVTRTVIELMYRLVGYGTSGLRSPAPESC